LHEGESVQKPSIDKLGDLRQRWVEKYDPSSLLPRCRVPILFMNGTNDVHYVLDSYQKSFDLVPGAKQMRIEVNMHHSHPDGWKPKEIGLFIDSYCNGGRPLPIPGKPIVEGGNVRLTCTGGDTLRSAALHYTTDGGLRSKRAWKEIPAVIANGNITAPSPPADANTWFISVTDNRDAMVTTDVQFAKP
jgi:hypothetical protein